MGAGFVTGVLAVAVPAADVPPHLARLVSVYERNEIIRKKFFLFFFLFFSCFFFSFSFHVLLHPFYNKQLLPTHSSSLTVSHSPSSSSSSDASAAAKLLDPALLGMAETAKLGV